MRIDILFAKRVRFLSIFPRAGATHLSLSLNL